MPVPPRHLCAVAMSSTRIRILRDLDRAGDAPDETGFEIPAQQLQDVMADKPGRSFASVGGGRRSAMEYGSDPLAEETRRMLRQAIDLLEGELRKGRVRELAIFAEPGVLGEWRKLAGGALTQAVIHEDAVNHLQLPPAELRRTLRAALGLPEG
jgi:protein required for attachment to host cells